VTKPGSVCSLPYLGFLFNVFCDVC